MFKKFSAAACMLLLSASISACGDNNEPAVDECSGDQIGVPADVKDGNGNVIIAEGCYDSCSTNADCASSEACVMTSKGGVCVGGSNGNNTTPANNTTPGNNTTPANNTTPGNNTTPANNTTPNNTTTNNSTPNNSTPNNTTTNNSTPNNTTPGMIEATGKECGGDADCGDSTCITELPGGYCSVFGCSTDADCGAGGACLQIAEGQTACLATCADDASCRTGYTCQAAGAGASVCLPPPPEPGAACATDDDCGGGVCFGLGEEGYCAFGCNADNPCSAGNTCGLVGEVSDDATLGICQPDCTDDSMCRADLTCTDSDADGDSECFIPVASGPGGPAAACTEVTDCSGGLNGFCIEEDMNGDFEDGYCTFVCEEDSECGAGNHCGLRGQVSENNPNLGLCVKDCSTGGDCSAVQFCGDADADGSTECWGQEIVPPCKADGDCDAGERCTLIGEVGAAADEGVCLVDCDTDATVCAMDETCGDADGDTTKECFPGELATGSGGVGEACTATADCAGGASGFCIEEQMDMGETVFGGGYCSLNCSNDPNSCPTGSACVQIDATFSLCLDECSANDACRANYECFDPTTNSVGTEGVCFEINEMMP